MRVALLAESFLPHMNGVTGSVLHALRHLRADGHEVLVIAPRSGEVDADLHGARTRLLRSVALPGYADVRVVFARAARLTGILREFRPDVVHLASPFVLGWQGLAAADALRVPAVSVYQTDVIAYAQKYGVPQATALVERHVARLHRRATLTLAPSASSLRQLEDLGVDRLRHWGRGVDGERFHPRRRDEAWRSRVAPQENIIGYVGRLAPEKQVEDLAALADIPGTRLVIVGDGPSRAALESAIPDALFTGHLSGAALAETMASFDVFVHPGESETFGQTIQEAFASGVPVVATGVGGPVDLVRSSIDGWLYRPGDLRDLRARVSDLLGDDGKRRAFGDAAREAVRDRTWDAVCRRLVEHYSEAMELRPIDDTRLVRVSPRPELRSASGHERAMSRTWSSMVAVGDSLTEGLCDASRSADGTFRGWADRLAELLGNSRTDATAFRYANLAVRSRRISDVLDDQLAMAMSLRPDLVTVFIGSNDLLTLGADPVRLAADLASGISTLRSAGIDVLLVTPVLPRRRAAVVLARRFSAFAAELRKISAERGAMLLDLETFPKMGEPDMWAADKVHFSARGHRFVAYRAAEMLGLPDAGALGDLDAALHADQPEPARGTWFAQELLPWAWRRLRRRTAGDGLEPKHVGYITVGGDGGVRVPGAAQ